MTTPYLFTSARLGFRNWLLSDLDTMAELNADTAVMEFFPATQTKAQTLAFIERMQQQLAEKGFCYFAVEVLATSEFIGFIGLSEKTFDADFTPCVDIGWRLKRSAWHQGFATEGALRCLDYGFNSLHLKHICSMAPVVNVRSEQIMKKINMQKVKHFKHPLLKGDARLEECVLYEIETKKQ